MLDFVARLCDPKLILKYVAWGQGVGATITVSLGGKADPHTGGFPLLILDAYVKAPTDGRFTLERW